jgi:hypothetical protein
MMLYQFIVESSLQQNASVLPPPTRESLKPIKQPRLEDQLCGFSEAWLFYFLAVGWCAGSPFDPTVSRWTALPCLPTILMWSPDHFPRRDFDRGCRKHPLLLTKTKKLLSIGHADLQSVVRAAGRGCIRDDVPVQQTPASNGSHWLAMRAWRDQNRFE